MLSGSEWIIFMIAIAVSGWVSIEIMIWLVNYIIDHIQWV